MSHTPFFSQTINNDDLITYTCKGDWTLLHVNKIYKTINNTHKNKTIIFDFNDINSFDTNGIVLLLDWMNKLETRGCEVKTKGGSDKFLKLFGVCKKNFPKQIVISPPKETFSEFFYSIGKTTLNSFSTLINFFSFVGGMSSAILKLLLIPHKIRFKATFFHIENSGLRAIPIIFLTSFLIGVVIAFQGAVQLEKFGANIFIVEMVAISVARELAPLLTAIVIAGRSASSFSAEIGVMKITEEIDAMKTMGFSVWNFLIIPRVFALMLSLPLLVFFADIVSISGGMVVASAKLGIGFEEFLARMQESVEIKHVIIGLVKAPIFGWIVASIGCFRGFQISGSTQSVGKYTTISVVNAIFWVIAMDALISVLLTEIGL
jgi:phospholipid/cholesterol/gamma-HCH transport system permease protein